MAVYVLELWIKLKFIRIKNYMLALLLCKRKFGGCHLSEFNTNSYTRLLSYAHLFDILSFLAGLADVHCMYTI